MATGNIVKVHALGGAAPWVGIMQGPKVPGSIPGQDTFRVSGSIPSSGCAGGS